MGKWEYPYKILERFYKKKPILDPPPLNSKNLYKIFQKRCTDFPKFPL